MPHALVQGYIDERDKLLNTVQVLKNNAADNAHDPSDADLEVMTKAYARIDKLDEYIKVVGEDKTMDAETREQAAPARTQRSQRRHPVPQRRRNGLGLPARPVRLHPEGRRPGRPAPLGLGHEARSAQHMGTDAPSTTPVAGGIGGLYVVPVVGPVINLFPQGQPFLSAIGRRPAPDAMTFTRPRIVDPDFYDGAGPQTLQKAELNSKKFDVKVDTLSLTTVGGYLNASQQLLSLQPSGWDLIVGQLQARTAWAGEAALVTEVAATGAHVPLAAGADSAAVLAALFEAASLVYTNTLALPTWIAWRLQAGPCWAAWSTPPAAPCSRSWAPPTPWARPRWAT